MMGHVTKLRWSAGRPPLAGAFDCAAACAPLLPTRSAAANMTSFLLVFKAIPHSRGWLSSDAPSQDAEEVYEIGLLTLGEADVVAAVIEVDQGAQIFRRAVGEIRRARRETAELAHDDRSDVVALAGDKRPARILRVNHSAEERMRPRVGVTGDLEQRQFLRDLQRRVRQQRLPRP